MLSLFADQEREAKLDSLGDPLALLNQHVDFTIMAAEIDRWVPRPSREKGGRRPNPTELMTRLLVLQQLFNLSDEQMEFQLLDCMSFQRFAGLKNTSQVPDRNTIWNFRERLIKARVEHLIFDEVQRQLQLHGFSARERNELLSAREREVLQNHLQAEIAAELQRLMRAADDVPGCLLQQTLRGLVIDASPRAPKLDRSPEYHRSNFSTQLLFGGAADMRQDLRHHTGHNVQIRLLQLEAQHGFWRLEYSAKFAVVQRIDGILTEHTCRLPDVQTFLGDAFALLIAPVPADSIELGLAHLFVGEMSRLDQCRTPRFFLPRRIWVTLARHFALLAGHRCKTHLIFGQLL